MTARAGRVRRVLAAWDLSPSSTDRSRSHRTAPGARRSGSTTSSATSSPWPSRGSTATTCSGLEGRPAEGGRRVLVRAAADGSTTDLTPAAVQRPQPGPRVRRRVVRRGRRRRRLLGLRRRPPVPARPGSEAAVPITPEAAVAPRRPAVRTRPAGGSSPSARTTPGTGHADQHDRRHPARRRRVDGPRQRARLRRLAAPVARRHAAGLARVGSPGHALGRDPAARRGVRARRHARRVRRWRPAGPEESIVQPEWAPDGTLHLISDRSGWWNLYRLVDGPRLEPLAPMDAEFADPSWIFDRSSYGFLPDGAIVAIARAGRTGPPVPARARPPHRRGRDAVHRARRAPRRAVDDRRPRRRVRAIRPSSSGSTRRPWRRPASCAGRARSTLDPAVISRPESIDLPDRPRA